MRPLLLVSSVFSLVLGGAAVGCSSNGGGGGSGGGTGGGSTADCSEYVAVGTEAVCPFLCPISNQDFCASVGVTPNCDDVRVQASVDVCGVGVPKPAVGNDLIELERSSNVDEFSGTGAPNLGCYSQSGFPSAPGTPQMVTMEGTAKVFSNGCESKNLEITVFEVIRDGSADDGMPGAMLGTTVMTDADCTMAGVPEDNDDCTDPKYNGQRWECTYSYPNVPTETELLIVSEGTGWAPLYEYNVYLANDDIVGGVVQKDVRALAQDDYQLIPQTAIGKNIESGNGAIGGEVHDCDDVRLINAIVDIDKSRVLTYFTDDEVSPLPDVSATSTSTLGLYSALDVKPGPVYVAAAGVLDGKLVGAGFFKARVFAGAVTSVTFRGLRPFQL
ncbi:MAG: hypothetical protein R3B72_17600 [Polyangiaceae bacterium]